MTKNKGSKKVILFLALGILLIYIVVYYVKILPAQLAAKSKVNTFCSSFSVGGSFEDAVNAAMAENGAVSDAVKKRFKGAKGEDVIVVGYAAGCPPVRYFCEIEGVEGKISKINYVYPR